jgi:hypothetical protein
MVKTFVLVVGIAFWILQVTKWMNGINLNYNG